MSMYSQQVVGVVQTPDLKHGSLPATGARGTDASTGGGGSCAAGDVHAVRPLAKQAARRGGGTSGAEELFAAAAEIRLCRLCGGCKDSAVRTQQ